MAEKKKEEKKAKPAAKKAAAATATAPPKAKPAAKVAAPARAAPKTQAKAAPKAKAPARRAVARPATRVVRREEEERPRQPAKRPQPKPSVVAHPLPSAPAGHAPIISADGTSSGSVELPAAITSPEQRRGVLFQALMAALSNARQANSATKNRARVAGGGAKPWRQKGTGRARQGSTRAPHWRHGGVVFGPNSRKYDQRIPGKMRRAAFAQALAAHAANGRVLVVDELRFESDRPRTREIAEWLVRVGDTGRAVLVTAEANDGVGRAAANLREFDIRTPGTLRLADVLRAQTMLVYRSALDGLAARAAVGAAQ